MAVQLTHSLIPEFLLAHAVRESSTSLLLPQLVGVLLGGRGRGKAGEGERERREAHKYSTKNWYPVKKEHEILQRQKLRKILRNLKLPYQSVTSTKLLPVIEKGNDRRQRSKKRKKGTSRHKIRQFIHPSASLVFYLISTEVWFTLTDIR